MPFELGFQLFTTDQSGVRSDISQLAADLQWSGSCKTVCRQLAYGLAYSPYDKNLPAVSSECGCAIDMAIGGQTVFGGTLLQRTRDSLSTAIDCVAFDWGIYLKNNYTYLKVDKQTPEAIAAQLAGKLGLRCGSIAATGIAMTRNFLPGSYYAIIQTLYSQASDQTGIKYQIRLVGKTLHVVEMVQNDQSILLKPGSNLLWCKTKEDASTMRNSVGIYDDTDVLDSTVDDASAMALYGVMQYAIQKSDEEDAAATAKQMLKDYGMKTDLTVQCAGNPKLLAGNTVVVEEPITGTYGLFYISSDVHIWQRGIYQCKLVLVLEAMMDTQSAGTVPTE